LDDLVRRCISKREGQSSKPIFEHHHHKLTVTLDRPKPTPEDIKKLGR
jgi:hypothetical protein